MVLTVSSTFSSWRSPCLFNYLPSHLPKSYFWCDVTSFVSPSSSNVPLCIPSLSCHISVWLLNFSEVFLSLCNIIYPMVSPSSVTSPVPSVAALEWAARARSSRWTSCCSRYGRRTRWTSSDWCWVCVTAGHRWCRQRCVRHLANRLIIK